MPDGQGGAGATLPRGTGAVWSAEDLSNLSLELSSAENWIRSLGTRHSGEQADIVHNAWRLIDHLANVADEWGM